MVSKLQVEDIWKNKILRNTKYEDKRNFISRCSLLLSNQDVMEFDPKWRLLENASNSYVVLISFYRIIHICYIIIILGFIIE